jgi:hypothetical protein
MTKLHKKHGRFSERGIALFIAIFTLLLITAIAAGMIMMTNTDTNISSNFRDEQAAYFGAKAGIEEVRDRMRTYTNPADSLASSLPGASAPNSAPPKPGQSGGIVYVTNPLNGETDTPWLISNNNYPDSEICLEMVNINSPGAACGANPTRPLPSTTWYNTASASSTYAASPALAWKWTRINIKTNTTSSGTSATNYVDGLTTDLNQIVCWNDGTEVSLPTTYATCQAHGWEPVYVLTTLAVTPSGSRRMVQADAAFSFPMFPGAMVFDGSNPTYNVPSSAAFGVSGNDSGTGPTYAGAPACPTPYNEPSLGAYNPAAQVTLQTAITANATQYQGGAYNVSPQLGALSDVTGLNSLVSTVTNAAYGAIGGTPISGAVYNGNLTSVANYGTPSNPVINVVTGDLTMGGSLSGSGILLVEGTLTLQGTPNYNGLILVIGKGSLIKNGGGNGTVNGSIMVANLYNSSNQLITSGAPGSPSINWGGGGNAQINYSSCWANTFALGMPYRIVGMREMMY